jgi:hypothetical protein
MKVSGVELGESRPSDLTPTGRKRHRDYQGRGHRPDALRRWDAKEFISWDGEGIQFDAPLEFPSGYVDDDHTVHIGKHAAQAQPYVLLANSKGDRITDPEGLGTFRCLEFLIQTQKKYPAAIFVGFGFNYDINQMLKDVPLEKLKNIHEKGTAVFSGYRVKWLPRKMFYVKNMKTRSSATIYDVFGYFGKAFILVCEKYLGKDDPDLSIIREGKAARELFRYEELEDFIIPYNDMELSMLTRIMTTLRLDLHNVGIDPGRWHGPGAVATQALSNFSVAITRTTPSEVLDASQFAYAGGWFEQFWLGRHTGTVYEYDIHSAYPAAAVHVPDLSKGHWKHVTTFEPDSFGVWSLSYGSSNATNRGYDRPEPLYCRAKNGSISHPHKVSGWYWTPEACLIPDCVREGWVFRSDTDGRPLAVAKTIYDQRRVYIAQENPAERALKLILNSGFYGKFAQTIGWDEDTNEPPRWHQLEWAGYITSYTRAKIWRAIQQAPQSIIAVETDAVFSTVPLDLPLSDELGDWELKLKEEITYLQSGLYYAIERDGKVICRYRGMDHDRNTGQPVGLPYERVLQILKRGTGFPYQESPKLRTQTTRFVGLGAMILQPGAVWRSWEKKARLISMDGNRYTSKRFHTGTECPCCLGRVSMYDRLHPTQIGGYSGESYARDIPWRKLPRPERAAPMSEEEVLEMALDYKAIEDRIAVWE